MALARRGLALGGAVLCIAPLLAGRPPAPTGSQATVVEAGRTVYFRECAACHGEAATGHGPNARLLRHEPRDLTVLSNRVRPFDRDSVRSGITGRIRLEPAHGASEMPYWRGSLVTGVPTRDGIIGEMEALLAYLESVQREPYGRTPGVSIAALAQAGAPLFANHCAPCHGADGRGPRLAGYLVGFTPPDLTTLATRSGGELDIRRLYEVIAKRHGEHSGMPGWEHSFARAGWPAAVTAAKLEALARYVESIQQH